jgi:hypothetical protein
MEPINMKGSFGYAETGRRPSIGVFALRFAATAILFAPAATVQAQGIGQSICRDVWDWGSGKYVHVCNSVYYPPPAPPPSPQPEPPVRHTTGSEEHQTYDPDAEARKAQLRATELRPSGETDREAVKHRAPPSSGLCSPPYRMTAQDGCQK